MGDADYLDCITVTHENHGSTRDTRDTHETHERKRRSCSSSRNQTSLTLKAIELLYMGEPTVVGERLLIAAPIEALFRTENEFYASEAQRAVVHESNTKSTL